MLSRREFLRRLGFGAAALAVLPIAAKAAPVTPTVIDGEFDHRVIHYKVKPSPGPTETMLSGDYQLQHWEFRQEKQLPHLTFGHDLSLYEFEVIDHYATPPKRTFDGALTLDQQLNLAGNMVRTISRELQSMVAG